VDPEMGYYLFGILISESVITRFYLELTGNTIYSDFLGFYGHVWRIITSRPFAFLFFIALIPYQNNRWNFSSGCLMFGITPLLVNTPE